MKTSLVSALLVSTLFTVSAAQAGCIKGAIVGGVAGHAVHHTLAGAAAGCVVGHHLAKKQDAAKK